MGTVLRFQLTRAKQRGGGTFPNLLVLFLLKIAIDAVGYLCCKGAMMICVKVAVCRGTPPRYQDTLLGVTSGLAEGTLSHPKALCSCPFYTFPL